MRYLKTLGAICLMALLVLSSNVFGQKNIEETYRLNRSETLSLDFRFPKTITINHWDRQEVSIQANVIINFGEDNDAFKLIEERTNGTLTIRSEIENIEEIYEKRKKKGWSDCNSSCMSIEITLYIPREIDLELETISGNIEMQDHNGDMRIKSIGGFVDLSIDARASADLALKTIGGEVYTNLEIPSKEGMRKIVGYDISHTLNRGGRNVSLESVGGDIFLRKKF